MRRLFLILIIISGFLLASCSRETQTGEVAFGDVNLESENSTEANDPSNPKQKNLIQINKNQADLVNYHSKISVTSDGYGNKAETRFFDNHSLLKCVIIRSFSGGQKQITVIANNGVSKSLSSDMYERALNATADEIGGAAGIFSLEKTEEPLPQTNTQPENNITAPSIVNEQKSENKEQVQTEKNNSL